MIKGNSVAISDMPFENVEDAVLVAGGDANVGGQNGSGANNIGKKKILPDMGEDENPFAGGASGNQMDQVNHQ